MLPCHQVRDWSLITGRWVGGGGGLQNGRGGACAVLSLRKGGGEGFSHIEGEGAKSFHSLNVKRFYPALRGWAQQVSDQPFSHFVAYPLPGINA